MLRGAQAVAEETQTNTERAHVAQPAVVDGAVGLLVAPAGRLLLAIRLTIEGGKVTEIDVVSDPRRLQQLDLGLLDAT